MKNYLVLVFIFSLLLLSSSFANWPCSYDKSVLISSNAGNQWNLQIASDGKSGAYFVWQDRRGGLEDKIYFQHVNSAGIELLPSGGIALSISPGMQYYPQVIEDGEGGIFVVWQDNRNGYDYDIYAQHVNLSGQVMWGTTGLLVCGAQGHQYNPRLTPDGAGGIIIVWQDKRSGQFDIYAQRVNVSGVTTWIPDGVLVNGENFDQVDPRITRDSVGGAIITWLDFRAGGGFPDIYSQRINLSGQLLWSPSGVPICVAQSLQWNAQIVSDGQQGAFIVWQDRRSGLSDQIYAQRVDQAGVVRWTQNGVLLSGYVGFHANPKMVRDNTGGIVVVWQDNRNGTDYDIFGQRVNVNGQLLWGTTGIGICVASGHQYYPQIAYDGGSILITWQDGRIVNDFDIYGQRADIFGNLMWGISGLPIFNYPANQISPQLVGDGAQGAIIGWVDYRSGTGYTDIYAHRIGANGKPAGGCYRSLTQESYSHKSIRIKPRRNELPKMPNGGNVRDTIFRRGLFPDGLVIGLDRSDSSWRYGWILYSRANNVRRALPQTAVARPFKTRGDRDFVKALKNPSVTRYDNKLVGELIALKLNIAASDAGITSPNFGDLIFREPFPTTNPLNNRSLREIAGKVDSFLTLWRWFPNVNYRLLDSTLSKINAAFSSTIDTISTNPLKLKSTRALFDIPFLIPNYIMPTQTSITQYQPIQEEEPTSTVLAQNYPNPFNPYTTIEFTILEPSFVTLKVYNILGQEVASLMNNLFLDEGTYLEDFDGENLASGVYFYHLRVIPIDENSKPASIIKRMVLLK